MSKLIFGCGYLGGRVAERWRADDQVFAVTRSAQRAEQWSVAGLNPILADITEPSTLDDLPHAETVLFAVGFDRGSGRSIEEVYVQGLRNVLDALPSTGGPVIYISSTGVYGQDDGSWVDECSACEPTRAGGLACLAAEQLLAAHPRGRGATILRLAGIYGPGRIPRLADLRAGKPLSAPSDGYLNLIHVDDAANVVTIAARGGRETRVYNVSDGAPVIRRDYLQELARLAGAPEPQFVKPAPDHPKTERASASKRIRNQRMLDELGPSLSYKSYREGLAAIVAEA